MHYVDIILKKKPWSICNVKYKYTDLNYKIYSSSRFEIQNFDFLKTSN